MALVNYSVVQHTIGIVASAYFSKEWNTKVSVKSINFNILNHIVLRGIELYTPEGDTVYVGEKISVRFNEFPFSKKGIKLDRVYMKNAYYCFEKYPDNQGINLNFIIKHYKKEKDDTDTTHNRFVVSVNQLILRNIEYQMYLPNYNEFKYSNGVNVKAMNFKHIDAKMSNIRVDASYIHTYIESFKAEEVSGFRLHKLKGNAYVSPNAITLTNMDLKTDYSEIKGDVSLLYEDWKMMSNYIHNVYMIADFKEGSYGGLKDAAYWAPMLWGFDAKVNIEGNFYGKVDDMHTNYAKLQIDNHTFITLNGYITGLPNMKETIIKADIDNLKTNINSLANVSLPNSWFKIKIPKLLKPLNDVNINGTFIGTIYEFFANANINTNIGNISVQTDVYQNDSTKQYVYDAYIYSPKIKINHLVPNNWISSTGLDINVNGEGFDFDNMYCKITNASLFNANIRNNILDNIDISAILDEKTINLTMNTNDTNLKMNLYADINMQDSLNSYIANITMDSVNLSKFDIWKTKNDTNIYLSTNINANLQGNDIDDIFGNISLENNKIEFNQDKSIFLKNISITAKELNNYRNITVNCGQFADFEAKGYFKYTDFARITQKFCNSFVPDNYNPFLDNNITYNDITDAEFEFTLKLSDSSNTIAKIIPKLFISENTSITGKYNYTESLNFVLSSDLMAYGNIVLDKLNISGSDKAGIYSININSNKLYTENTTFLKNIDLDINSTPKILQLSLLWNSFDNNNQGNINIDIANNRISNFINIHNSDFVINNEKWNIVSKHTITADSNTLIIPNLSVNSNMQAVNITSDVKKGISDSVCIVFNNFGLEQFNAFIAATNIKLDGNINGDLNINNLYSSPYFDASLAIHDWKINNQNIGDANITSNWDIDNKALNINLQSNLEQNDKMISPLTMSGYFYPMNEDNNMDFEVNFDGFSLKSLEPFLSSFSSRFEGDLHGAFSIKGNTEKPQIAGSAMIDKGVIKIDYTNTSYFFDDSIIIDNQNIIFNDFKVRDEKNNIAIIKGDIYHYFFKNFDFNIDFSTNNFLAINTLQPDYLPFYGTIYVNADAKISGNDKKINIEVQSQTNKNSSINILLDDKRILKEQNFIQFVKREVIIEEKNFFDKNNNNNNSTNKINYTLNLNIEATPDIKVNLPMDFSSMKAVVAAVGQGNLRLNIGSDADFSIMGDYNINSGTFKVDFLNLLTRELKIENGSSVNWTGEPTGADINIKGVYDKRVSLSSLTGSDDAMTNISHKSVNVESIISLNGKLNQPKIGFDFRLPNVDQSTEEEVYALIDRSNEREMINQTISLLLTGEFLPASGTSNGMINNGLGSGVDLVTNQVSSIITGMIKVVDVNFEYKSQTSLLSEQLNIDVSKEWNKFYFETTFGWGGNRKDFNIDSENTNNLIGDMLIGYKITPYLHVIVFNRSNVNDYTKQNLPYTQGVGLKYTHSFDSWKTFFRNRIKEKNKTDNK